MNLYIVYNYNYNIYKLYKDSLLLYINNEIYISNITKIG